MKSEQEIKEELEKCEDPEENSHAFFLGWFKALEWVLK